MFTPLVIDRNPDALLATIEDKTASYADRIDAVAALMDWLTTNGRPPVKAPFLVSPRDVKAMWRGMGVARPSGAIQSGSRVH